MKATLILLVLLVGCESQPTTKSDIKIWRGSEGQDAKLWHVTLDLAIEAPGRAEAVSRAAAMLEAMSKASEMPPVLPEKEEVPRKEGS
jgi:hypothetical protein